MAEGKDKKGSDKVDTQKKHDDAKIPPGSEPWAPQKSKDTVTVRKNTLMIVSVIIIIIAVAAVAAFVLSSGRQQIDTRTAAKYGDTVSVRYVGKFENNTVFDTNVASVAAQAGLQRTSFQPLVFTIGQNQVISGFDAAVIGMHTGDKKTVTLEPSQAYGEYDQQLLITIPRTQEINRTVTINRTFVISNRTYELIFSKAPVLNDIVTEQQENIQYKVINVSGGNITIESVVAVGQNLTLFGTEWNSTVLSITPKNVTLRQNPADGQVMQTYLGNSTISVTENKIRITANPHVGERISTPAGAYLVKAVTEGYVTLDANHPLAGKRLVFDIELLNITAAAASKA